MRAYASEARQHCGELAAMLAETELSSLRETLEEDGPKGAWLLVEAWRDDALPLVEATPSQRAARLRSAGEGRRLLTLYAAVVLSHLAWRLVEAVSVHAIEPGGPYRKLSRRAAAAAFELAPVEPSLWPFVAEGPSWSRTEEEDGDWVDEG